MEELKRQCPGFLVLLQATAGCADRAIVGNGRTTFWEMKHATPDFDSPGNQELFCQRLAVQAYCRYVIWQENKQGVGARTLIVHPREVAGMANWNVQPESFCVGYDHSWLVEQIRKAHGLS